MPNWSNEYVSFVVTNYVTLVNIFFANLKFMSVELRFTNQHVMM